VRVDGEGQRNKGDLEDGGGAPCGQMRAGGRGLRVEQRDEEQAVDKEGADEVDLAVLAVNCRAVLSRAVRTTTDLPAHQCSFFMTSECVMTSTELPTKVRAVASDTHSKTRFCVCVTSSRTARLTKLRVGSVAGSGLPPGPVVVGWAILALELDAAMLRVVKAARKKTSRTMG
jgi:hypothetical protein